MRLGAHNSIAGGVWNAVDEAVAIGADVMQIFCKNQRQWNAPPLAPDDARRFRDAAAEAGLGPVMVHDSYLINMGTPDLEKRARAQAAFQAELERCEALGVAFLNFHPGSHTHPKKALRDDEAERLACLDRIADCVNDVLDAVPGNVIAVVENAAGQGTNVGTSWAEVGYLVDQLPKDRRGVCVDTQHAWAAGHDWLSDYDGVWERFDDQVGLEELVAFHLNDSDRPLGARVDRHAPIGQGEFTMDFWENIMQDARFSDTPGYLETPGGPDLWRKEIALLRQLAD